jgi:hypothetical protein
MVGSVTGSPNDLEGSEPAPFVEQRIYVAPRRCDRRAWEPLPDLGHGVSVVGVVVRERDAAEATAPLELGCQLAEVLVERRTRVHKPRRAAPHDPRIRAR